MVFYAVEPCCCDPLACCTVIMYPCCACLRGYEAVSEPLGILSHAFLPAKALLPRMYLIAGDIVFEPEVMSSRAKLTSQSISILHS